MLLVSKTLRYSFCACVRNMFKIVILAIGKLKLATFSLFLDAFPPRPNMSFGQWNHAIYIYNICKGRLRSEGMGCISQRRHQTSDKNRLLCKMVFFIVHQLYKYIYSIVIWQLFTLVKRSISHML